VSFPPSLVPLPYCDRPRVTFPRINQATAWPPPFFPLTPPYSLAFFFSLSFFPTTRRHLVSELVAVWRFPLYGTFFFFSLQKPVVGPVSPRGSQPVLSRLCFPPSFKSHDLHLLQGDDSSAEKQGPCLKVSPPPSCRQASHVSNELSFPLFPLSSPFLIKTVFLPLQNFPAQMP